MRTTPIGPNEYATLVEQAPILIWRADLTMGCDYFNERWLSFTGRTMEQEHGNGWAEGVHPEDRPRCFQTYTESFTKRQTFEMEYRLRRSDGAFRWIFDRGGPFYDATGEFAGYIGSCIDVTERVEAQAQLRAVHDREIRMLRGLLPICSGCKKIRDEKNDWHEVESYVMNHSDATFSHGLCPTCLPKYFPDIALESPK